MTICITATTTQASVESPQKGQKVNVYGFKLREGLKKFIGVSVNRGVNPYEKSWDFYKLFCEHSYSTREAKVDKGVHLFF